MLQSKHHFQWFEEIKKCVTRESLELCYLTQLELFDSCSVVAVPSSINGIKSSSIPSVEIFAMSIPAENPNLNQS